MKDDYGFTMQNVRDKLDIKLSDETAAQLATQPIQYETGFTLLPGKYVIKLLARDAETGRIGTYQAAFTVPNLMTRSRSACRSAPSSSAASACRSATRCYTVSRRAQPTAVNPLVFDGQKLIPSVTRVFSRSRDLYVFLQAYERGADDDAAAGRVRHASTRATEGVRDAAAAGRSTASTRGRRPCRCGSASRSTSSPPGRYDCQVTVLDPTGQKVAFWQAPIVLVP